MAKRPPPADLCFACGAVNDAATSATGDEFTPSAGAVSVCIRCSAIGIFTGEGMTVRPATEDERAAAIADPQFRQAMLIVAAFQAIDGGRQHG